VMHPGPMNRGVEIDTDVADDIARSAVLDQVEMGVAVRQAVLELLLVGEMMSDEKYNPYQTSDLDPIDMHEGHEDECNHIMGKLHGNHNEALTKVERAELQARFALLNAELEERNRRLDSNYFNWER